LVVSSLKSPAQNPPAAGQQLFASRCAGCHGLDGRGGEHAPNIATDANAQRLTDSDIARIVRHGIRAAGMPAFGSSFSESQIAAVVKYLRSLQGAGAAVTVAGNPDHGRTLFFGTAHCSDCHMMNGEGGFIASDLSYFGKAHSLADIREAIVNPNKNPDPRQGTVVVSTNSGQKYTGVLRNEDNFSLQMQTADGNFHFFDKLKVARIERQSQSLMPSDYASRLSKSELDDVVSYLVKDSKSRQGTDDEPDRE
jgi:putative heme-binding domain-containing protein